MNDDHVDGIHIGESHSLVIEFIGKKRDEKLQIECTSKICYVSGQAHDDDINDCVA